MLVISTFRPIAALVILGITGTAYGGPPFVANDPELVDNQHWEFYVASQDAKLGGDWSGASSRGSRIGGSNRRLDNFSTWPRLDLLTGKVAGLAAFVIVILWEAITNKRSNRSFRPSTSDCKPGSEGKNICWRCHLVMELVIRYGHIESATTTRC